MLPKKFRLSKSEFQAVRKAGRLLSGRLLAVLVLLPSSLFPLPSVKAGLIVSRRLSSKAVARNLLKRRLRAALQRILPDLSPNLHLVVLPNRRALDSTVAELEKEIKSLITATASK